MFSVGGLGFGTADLWIDMAIRHKDVEPSIVVHVEEADAPAEIACVDTPRRDRCGPQRYRLRGWCRANRYHRRSWFSRCPGCRHGCNLRWKRPCRPGAFRREKTPRLLRWRCL